MGWLNLVGIYGLAGLCLIIGYLFYDKSEWLSRSLIFVGVCLTIAIIVSEISLRHNELEARKRGLID